MSIYAVKKNQHVLYHVIEGTAVYAQQSTTLYNFFLSQMIISVTVSLFNVFSSIWPYINFLSPNNFKDVRETEPPSSLFGTIEKHMIIDNKDETWGQFVDLSEDQ